MSEDPFKKHKQDARHNVRLLRQTGRGGTLLDCGANIGEVALSVAAQFDRVVAVEANPRTFAVAQERCRGLENVSLLNAAVSKETGGVLFVSNPSYCGMGATARSKRRAGKEYCEVATVGLNDLIKDHNPRVVKLDIEGCEFDALAGVKYFGCVEWIVAEFHGKICRVQEAVTALNGFEVVYPDALTRAPNWTLRTIVLKRRSA